MINVIGNIIGAGRVRVPYAKKLAKAYEARVIADGGNVEALSCFIAFAKAWGAEPITATFANTQWQLSSQQWQLITTTWN